MTVGSVVQAALVSTIMKEARTFCKRHHLVPVKLGPPSGGFIQGAKGTKEGSC